MCKVFLGNTVRFSMLWRNTFAFPLHTVTHQQKTAFALNALWTANSVTVQIISTACDQFSRTDSSQNKGTPSPPLHIDLAIFSLSSQSGLSSAFRGLLLTGSLTAHIRLNKSFCQFLVSHFESWRYTQCKSSYESAKMILRRIVRLDLCWNLAWFAYSVVITKITVTANTFFRAVKSDVPASPSAYSLPWAGGSRGSTGCVCAPHRCSLLCLPETHNTEYPDL